MGSLESQMNHSLESRISLATLANSLPAKIHPAPAHPIEIAALSRQCSASWQARIPLSQNPVPHLNERPKRLAKPFLMYLSQVDQSVKRILDLKVSIGVCPSSRRASIGREQAAIMCDAHFFHGLTPPRDGSPRPRRSDPVHTRPDTSHIRSHIRGRRICGY